MDPSVSVLIPAFNAQATIVEAVTSALSQTLGDLEVVVVDDGSSVPVAKWLHSLNDERLRILRTVANRGVAAARNTALAAARAQVVAQLDADDLWRPSHLEALLPAFEDPRVGLSYANAEVVGHPLGIDQWIGSPGPEGARRSVNGWQTHPVADLTELLRGNSIPACAVTIRASAARGVGGYPEWLSIGEDYALYIRLLAAGWRFAFTDRRSAVYRWPEPRRGVTFSRRTVSRQQLKLYTVLAMQSPLQIGRWRRIALQVVQVVTTHVPALGWIPRRLRALRGRNRN